MDCAAYFLSLYIISYLENDDLLLYLSQVRQTTMVWLYLTVSRLKELLAQVDLKKQEISSKLQYTSVYT